MNSLRGIKVLELNNLVPGTFLGKILKDFGATVIRLEKIENSPDLDILKEGKYTLKVNLLNKNGQDFVRNLCKNADVLIDPFRKGILEKLNLNPKNLVELNKKLVVARLSGYGQFGPLANRAGHDINFLSLSGLLSQITSEEKKKPVFPINLLGDFTGSLVASLGICLALIERNKTGKGKIIDSNITESILYFGSWIFKSREPDNIIQSLIWPNLNDKHANLLDGGSAFYNCYETKDKKYMALGTIEPKFFEIFKSVLFEKTKDDVHFKKFNIENFHQFDDDLKNNLEQIFLLKTRDEWWEIFSNTDSLCTPVLEIEEVSKFPHFKIRKHFLDKYNSVPMPKFIEDIVEKNSKEPDLKDVLRELKIDSSEIENLVQKNIINIVKSKL